MYPNHNRVLFCISMHHPCIFFYLSVDCCVNRVCWCFTTKGMCTVGQDEIVVLLELMPDEKTIPKDLFCHFNTVYEEAGKGKLTLVLRNTSITTFN